MTFDLTQRKQAIEKIAFSIKGVVAVNIGLSKQQVPVIKILVDVEVSTISKPKELIAPDIEWQYIGQINAQINTKTD